MFVVFCFFFQWADGLENLPTTYIFTSLAVSKFRVLGEKKRCWLSVSSHLSLQHVSSQDARRPVLCAVGAPDGQTVCLALLLGVACGRSGAAAAPALHRHLSYLVCGPAPSSVQNSPDEQVNKRPHSARCQMCGMPDVWVGSFAYRPLPADKKNVCVCVWAFLKGMQINRVIAMLMLINCEDQPELGWL